MDLNNQCGHHCTSILDKEKILLVLHAGPTGKNVLYKIRTVCDSTTRTLPFEQHGEVDCLLTFCHVLLSLFANISTSQT